MHSNQKQSKLEIMQKSIILFLIVLLPFGMTGYAYPSKVLNDFSDSLNLDQQVERLSVLFEMANETKADSSMEQFFEAFPSSFVMFEKIYGFLEGKPSPLYYESLEQVRLFWETESFVEKDIFMDKVIMIAMGGDWSADGVSFFQSGLMEYVDNYLSETVQILEKYEAEEVSSFWSFLFAGPCPPKTIPIDIELVRSQNSAIAALAESAFSDARRGWFLPN
jgi:hypothetical protein